MNRFSINYSNLGFFVMVYEIFFMSFPNWIKFRTPKFRSNKYNLNVYSQMRFFGELPVYTTLTWSY